MVLQAAFLLATMVTLFPRVTAQGSTTPLAFVNLQQSLNLCTPATFQWTGGTGPFDLQIRIPSGQVSVLAELPFTNISAQHFTWTPDIEGSNLVVMLFDSSNATTTSSPFSVQSSRNTTCSRAQSEKDTAPIVMVDPSATTTSTLAPGLVAGVAVAAAIVLAGTLALSYWICIANRARRGFKRVGAYRQPKAQPRNLTLASAEIDDWELLSDPESPSDSMKKGILYHGDECPTIVVTSPSIAPSISSHVGQERTDNSPFHSVTPRLTQKRRSDSLDEDEDVPLIQLAPAHSTGHTSRDVIFSAEA